MLDSIRNDIRDATLTDEAALVTRLIDACALDENARDEIARHGAAIVSGVRGSGKVGIMEKFLAEYALSTDEGVALMCLAEAMLRVPDSSTVDALIKDKIAPHDWSEHLGKAGSILVNASTWGLMLTGRVIDESGVGVAGTLHALVKRLGEPAVRIAVGQVMTEMGNQFVLGRSIKEAMKRGQANVKKGYGYSYDMLGEAALTDADAQRYHTAYADAIQAIAANATSDDVRDNPGISVKLSALHPRYEYAQREDMLPLLSARLLSLALAAKTAQIGFNIDAEEADRLDLSLDVIETVLGDTRLQGWDGFGVVVQAYGRRADETLDWLYALASKLDRKIMVRLVKGAYWDTEIKRAQVMGLDDFPVFTRKAHTDVSYLACSRKLLNMRDRIYPQFATHNAHSAAAVLNMAGPDRSGFEFQRLHGMGEALHAIIKEDASTRCRIYAPVGAHADLLAYLVRRLLENGANGSFVNQIVDKDIPAEHIARDPIDLCLQSDVAPSAAIERAADLFAPRQNSQGWDLTDPRDLAVLNEARAPFSRPYVWHAAPISPAVSQVQAAASVVNPARADDRVGTVSDASAEQIDAVVKHAGEAQPAWAALGPHKRAAILRKTADLYEQHTGEFLALATREAGKTLLDGVAEIREAVDFLRYYADEALKVADLPARGVIVCISPWNFPLAIFTGQIAAALAAGNAVIAKPAEQTPLIAHRAIELMHAAGVPVDVMHFLPGDGAVIGAALTQHSDISGVCFTGSTEVAKHIDRQLAKTAPEALLIAETGGLNAMIVDSTALVEQAVRDIVRAAFQSAGQRCSALRILYVQEDVAEQLLERLKGAMDALVVGDPWQLATDTGPVIDTEAYDGIAAYIAQEKAQGRLIHQVDAPEGGLFIPPTAVKTDGIGAMGREIFGPVLHVATYKAAQLDTVVDDINAKGYGLTFGMHTRIDQRVQRVLDRIHVGNVYVNRDQIGAIVGSQPFGGHGLSGTGPKAGGEHYLPKFLGTPYLGPQFVCTDLAGSGMPTSGTAIDIPTQDQGASAALENALAQVSNAAWAKQHGRIDVLREALDGQGAAALEAAAQLSFGPSELPGPTGESNQYSLGPRGTVLCLGGRDAGETLLAHVVQALAAGNTVVAMAPDAKRHLAALLEHPQLPLCVLEASCSEAILRGAPIDLVAAHTDPATRATIRRALAERDGPIVQLVDVPLSPVSFAAERTVCIDTTAAGGNVSLLSTAQ